MRSRAAALLALALAAAAPAQERSVVHTIDGRDAVVVRVVPFQGAGAVGGFGFAIVEAESRDDRGHEVVVAYESHAGWQSNVAVRRELALGPRELGRAVLPLPTDPDPSHRLTLSIDGTRYEESFGTRHDGLTALLVSARGDADGFGQTVLNGMPRAPRQGTAVVPIPPELLPHDWRWFTGFHAVVVDGRTPLGGEAQTALVAFATAGGTVVVGDAERLPPGTLRERCRAPAPDGLVRLGIGRIVPCAVGGDSSALRAALAALPAPALAGWPAPELLLRPQVVPGLGEAPVVVFLCVILLFALVVGPINFFLLRRWRRPLLVLVTVPACGLGTTLLMLGYGLVHDGLGVRGVVRSWTLLDQDRHAATSLAERTLFAGLPPDVLTVEPDGVLIAPRACWRGPGGGADRWQFDPATHRLDGGVLPSRSRTPLLSARHGLARQRLRARAAGERLELLPAGAVAPVGERLLRDFDGRYWLGEAPSLQAGDDDAARAALRRFRRDAAVMAVDDGDGGPETASAHHLVARFTAGEELPPGSYVARVAAAPWLDGHGLDVAYDAETHFVIGRLAPEDLAR